MIALAVLLTGPAAVAQPPSAGSHTSPGTQQAHRPPRVAEAERFLAQRGWTAGNRIPARANALLYRTLSSQTMGRGQSTGSVSPAAATWTALGPTAVQTPNFGLVTGRISSIAFDPSDATGNRVYVGTTGGGAWFANDAGTSNASAITFTPLTDNVTALGGAAGASISIGALSVQPGGTGVILVGTGDPNDALDSYYGAGILRSTDSGTTWSLISTTEDIQYSLGAINASFVGEGFAGFAWSTTNPQNVVAAVSQAYESTLVGSDLNTESFTGLYYSNDSGATWFLATITDGSGAIVQRPGSELDSTTGNPATAVVWNPMRRMFVAAVRYHGYYESPDGVTWTRMTAQPGTGLTTQMCPTNANLTGSIACPIFRGALAVNPQTGDTFAWTVDANDQDQGLWQDQCAMNSSGSCSNTAITFASQWSTAALESSTLEGPLTIADGAYNLALAAVPSQQDTIVLAGANDLWKCSLAMGCVWRNTTNALTCPGSNAQVGEFQHVAAWPDLAWYYYPAQQSTLEQEILLGNDSGLWRSTDAIGETGSTCSASDATHFQNLNGGLGSLAEVQSLSPIFSTPHTLMAGLGVNGTAGVKSGTPTPDWPQIFSGYGGPVAIDSRNNSNWYINDQAGVAIYECSQAAACTPAAFGSSPVVTDADVGGDGYAMPTPAPFLVDPADSSQLLIGTCRVWRGPVNGSAWTASNAISPILDSGAASGVCSSDALIRSIAALLLSNGSEVIYVGTYGYFNNGERLPGHVLSATFDPSSGSLPHWTDLSLNQVVNDTKAFNYYEYDISSVTVDTHDLSGNTIYATVEGVPTLSQNVRLVYRSVNGGASWSDITANLPPAPVSAVAIDPQSANTVYVATDAGVFFTTEVGSCAQASSNCWSEFGVGLPGAPVVALSAAPASASQPVLVAATYGRGTWQTPLFTADVAITSAAASPPNVAFTQAPAVGTASQPIQVQLFNTGSLPLTVSSIVMGGSDAGDFSETDTCTAPAGPIAVGGECSIGVTFTPQAANTERTAVMIVYGNLYGGQLTVDLTGTGTAAGGTTVTLSPNPVSFTPLEVGSTSLPLSVALTNSGTSALAISSVTATPPFLVPATGNSCGTSVGANGGCQIEVEFSPTEAGVANGLLTVTDADGTQTVSLSGTGLAPPTDILNTNSNTNGLVFAPTSVGQSASLSVTITNTGDLALTGLSASVASVPGGEFQVASSPCNGQVAAQHPGVCTIAVQFVPTQAGEATGTLTITDALRSQTVALSGTGIAAPAFTVNPASLTFTNQQPGVASAPQSVTITNSGGAPMANVGFAITGAAASSYSFSPGSCGTLVNNGPGCTVQIVFTPNATGVIAATLVVSSSTQGVAPASIPLNGAGQLAAGLATNPAQLNFAVLGAGQSSPAQAVTVTNSSNYAIGAVSVVTAAPFSVTQNNCSGGIAAGANCTASVVFQPTAGGSSTGVLTVTSSGVAAPATVALTGTGFDFTLTASGPTIQTVASGQQANYTLVITPNGSGGSFSFSCGTLPANALCLFNPNTETLNPGVQGNVEVEISTGGGATARADRPNTWRTFALACGMFLVPFAIGRRRRAFLLIVLAAILVCGVASCTSSGGGSGGTGGSGGSGSGSSTPAGTYTIPVTVTSTGVSHSMNLSLTVD